MTERYLHSVEGQLPSHIDQIATAIEKLSDGVMFPDDRSTVIIPGYIPSDNPEKPHRLNVHLYDQDKQHGPRPNVHVAELVTTSVTKGPEAQQVVIVRILLTCNRVSKTYALSQVFEVGDSRQLRVCDEHQEEVVASWLEHFQRSKPI